MADKKELSILLTSDTTSLVNGIDKAVKSVDKLPASALKAGKAVEGMGKAINKGFDATAAGNAALATIYKNIDKAADAAIKGTGAFANFGKGPYKILGIIPPLKNAQKELANTAITAAKLDSTLAKGAKGADAATQSLINVGRIAQDLPFGFIGIANNLNPLIESFQRLRKEAGSNVGALKALGSSLMGAGGVGIAFSLITAAMSFASIGMQAWTGYNKKSKEATDENKKAVERIGATYDAFVQEIENVSKAMATEAAKVQILALALDDANTSALQRKNIISELNDISPKYLGHLDKEKASYEQIAKAVYDYTESLAKSVEIKALLPEFEKLIQKIIKAQVDLNQLRRLGTDEDNIFGIPLAEFNAEQKRLLGIIKGTTSEVRVAKMALTDIAGSGLSLSEILFGKEINKKDGKEKIVKDIKTVNDVLAEMRKQIALLNKEEIGFNTDNAEERYNTFLSAIKTLNIKFGQSLDGDLLQGLFGEAKFAKVGFIVENGFASLGVAAKKAFNDAMKNLAAPPEAFTPPVIPKITDYSSLERASKEVFLRGQGIKKSLIAGIGKVPLRLLNNEELDAAFNEAQAKLDEFNVKVATAINTSVVDTFSAFGEALGSAMAGMSGENIFGSFFKSVLTSLGSGMQKLGIELLAANKAILLAKATFGKALGIPGSIAIIALGGLIKSLANNIKVPAFANGVQNFSGGLALVGERGPEYVNLPRGSDVIPNHELGSIGGGQQVFIPETRIKGQDIVIAFNRASATNSRNGF